MPKTTQLDPSALAQLALQVVETRQAIAVPTTSKGRAVYFRQQFYIWRAAQRSRAWEGFRPEVKHALESIVLTVQGSSIIMQERADPFSALVRESYAPHEGQEDGTT